MSASDSTDDHRVTFAHCLSPAGRVDPILRTPSSIRPVQRAGIGWVQTGEMGSTPKEICEITPAKKLEQSVRSVSPIGADQPGSDANTSFFESGGFQFELPDEHEPPAAATQSERCASLAVSPLPWCRAALSLTPTDRLP